MFYKGEIIKIGQSSHKMYNNNILNFQESTTILNAVQKKSLETFWIHLVYVTLYSLENRQLLLPITCSWLELLKSWITVVYCRFFFSIFFFSFFFYNDGQKGYKRLLMIFIPLHSVFRLTWGGGGQEQLVKRMKVLFMANSFENPTFPLQNLLRMNHAVYSSTVKVRMMLSQSPQLTADAWDTPPTFHISISSLSCETALISLSQENSGFPVQVYDLFNFLSHMNCFLCTWSLALSK